MPAGGGPGVSAWSAEEDQMDTEHDTWKKHHFCFRKCILYGNPSSFKEVATAFFLSTKPHCPWCEISASFLLPLSGSQSPKIKWDISIQWYI